MSLYHLTVSNFHDGTLSSLHHLIAQNTLEGQLEAFLINCQVEGLSPHTLKYYRYQVGAFIRFCQQKFNITQPDKVTADEIRLFILSLQEHNNPVSVHDYFRASKRFFNWLVERKRLTESPMKGMKAPRVPDYIIRPFSRRDIEALLLLTDGERFLQVRNRAIVLVFLDTGLRLTEMAHIHLEDIDMDCGTIRVMGKGARERLVRIGKNAQKVLLRYLLQRHDNYSELWLSEEMKPLTVDGLQCIVKVLCHRAGIKDAKCGPHAFRHTAATECLRNGMQETMVQNMLGHKDLRMTRRYTLTINSDDMLKAHIKASPVDNLLK